MIRLFFCVVLCGTLFHSNAQQLFHEEIDSLFDPDLKPFYFSVASGDPHFNSVTIWTKIWRETSESIAVQWEVATDTLMQNIVQAGESATDSGSAFTVKVLAQNLQPHTTYFYRFKFDNTYSPVGRTKTAPENNVDSLRFAVVSCSNYEAGYFNAYRLVAEHNDLDAVIHLGDYIYEYSRGTYGDKKSTRRHIPQSEILSLKDYRSRYAQYRLDKNLQEMHRLHPMISIWDDHEFANNTYKDGAGNHQTNEGDWEVRKANGKKAYFEWLPIPDDDNESIIRIINYGNLAEMFLLDERTEARSRQLRDITDSTYYSPERTMIGAAQEQWLTDGIASSTAHWKLFANQVMFSELKTSKAAEKRGLGDDIWVGYPAERERILNYFHTHQLKNIIIITGDIHTSWAFDLVQHPLDKTQYNRKTGLNVMGAEFITPSITSAGLAERVKSKPLARMAASYVNGKNPHLLYINLSHHGYMLLTLTKEKATAQWIFVNTILKTKFKSFSPVNWSTLWGTNRLFKEK